MRLKPQEAHKPACCVLTLEVAEALSAVFTSASWIYHSAQVSVSEYDAVQLCFDWSLGCVQDERREGGR